MTQPSAGKVKLAREALRVAESLRQEFGRLPSVYEIAYRLDVPGSKVARAIAYYMAKPRRMPL